MLVMNHKWILSLQKDTINLKNRHNLEDESYVLFSRKFSDLSLRGSISSSPERWGDGGGIRLYRRLQQKVRWSEHQKDFCELKKTRYLKLRNLVLFYYGMMQEWGLTEIILFLSQLSGASNLCFSHPEFLRAHCREWFSLMAARSQVFFSFLSALRAQEFTWHPCLLIWQEILHLSIPCTEIIISP